MTCARSRSCSGTRTFPPTRSIRTRSIAEVDGSAAHSTCNRQVIPLSLVLRFNSATLRAENWLLETCRSRTSASGRNQSSATEAANAGRVPLHEAARVVAGFNSGERERAGVDGPPSVSHTSHFQNFNASAANCVDQPVVPVRWRSTRSRVPLFVSSYSLMPTDQVVTWKLPGEKSL